MDRLLTKMSADSKFLLELVSVPTEVEAAVIVAALERDGIQAVAAGALTSGFRAEAPGEVQVLVRRSDADRAGQVLRTSQSQETPIDWSQVDVGDPEE